MRIAPTFRTLLTAFFGRATEPESASTIHTFSPKSADQDANRLLERDERFYWARFVHGHC